MKTLAWLTRLEEVLCFVGFVVMALSLIADVASRLFLGHGIVGAPQVGLVGMLVTALFALGPTAAAGEHFRPRMFDELCPAAFRFVVVTVGHFLTAVFFAVLLWLSVVVVLESKALEELTSLLRWPVWILQSVFIVAFGFNVLRYLIYALSPGARPTADQLSGALASNPVEAKQ